MQAALSVIGELGLADDGLPIDLSETWLNGANLVNAILNDTALFGAHLENALLSGASLKGAVLEEAISMVRGWGARILQVLVD